MGILRELQEEQKPWVLKNFGARPASQPLRGIVEEFGELIEAELDANRPAMKDAVADVAIFMCDYCTALGLDFEEIYEASVRPRYGFFTGNILVSLGRLAHADLKLEQGIRGSREQHVEQIKTALTILVSALRSVLLLNNLGLELPELAWAVWERVRLRDWKKDAVTAGGHG